VDALPDLPIEWLRERRWFSSKGRTVAGIEVTDWGVLPLEQPGVVAFVLVQYTQGRSEQYFLPLIADPAEQPEGARTPPAFTFTHGNTIWYVHDAFQFASFQRWLMTSLIVSDELPLQGGRLVFRPEQALHQSPPLMERVRLVTAEQSNSSIIYDQTAILKCFRRVVAGVNPDVELSRFLTTRAEFTATPAMLGSIAYVAANGEEHSLGLAQAFVANKGDAWEHTLTQLNRYFATAGETQVTTDDALLTHARRLAADQLSELRELGERTGELHVALASASDEPDLAPRPLTSEQVVAWQDAIRKEAAAIMDELARREPQLAPEQQSAVQALLQARARIEQRIAELCTLGDAGVVTTRYHGDYHLGQVLVSEQGFLILDFEGEPLRSLAERRAHHSPLKDVAGMLRSLSYAAHSGVRATRSANDKTDLDSWAAAWEQCGREAFLDGYLRAASGAAFLPKQPDVFHSALAVFELEKALYELNYELNNRPDWLPIPLTGIQRIVA